MTILEELKAKANGAANQANNIQEAISMMEFGGGSSDGSVLIVGGATFDGRNFSGTLDKTWQEIHDAMQSKICIVVITNGNNIAQGLITRAFVDGGEYGVISATSLFTTSTANGYPAVGGGDGGDGGDSPK